MTTEEKLKAFIVSKYASVAAFADVCGLPYQTVNSILKRGIKNAGVSNVIDMCKTLGLSVEDLYSGEFVYTQPKDSITSLEDLLSILSIQLRENTVTFCDSHLSENESSFVENTLQFIPFMLQKMRAAE